MSLIFRDRERKTVSNGIQYEGYGECQHIAGITKDYDGLIAVTRYSYFPELRNTLRYKFIDNNGWNHNGTLVCLSDENVKYIDETHIDVELPCYRLPENITEYILNKKNFVGYKETWLCHCELYKDEDFRKVYTPERAIVFNIGTYEVLNGEDIDLEEYFNVDEELKREKHLGKYAYSGCIGSTLLETKEEIEDYVNGDLTIEEWSMRKIYKTFSVLGLSCERIKIIQGIINGNFFQYDHLVRLYRECIDIDEFMYLAIEGDKYFGKDNC